MAEAEVEGATTTTTMVEEVVATSMEAEAADDATMSTRSTSIRGINSTLSHLSNSQCLEQFYCPIQRPVQYHTFRTTTWIATQIKVVTTRTVAYGATDGHTGRDLPNLVQRVSS